MKNKITYKELPFCEHCGDGYKVFGVEVCVGGTSYCMNCASCDGDIFTPEEEVEIFKKEKEKEIAFYKSKLK